MAALFRAFPKFVLYTNPYWFQEQRNVISTEFLRIISRWTHWDTSEVCSSLNGSVRRETTDCLTAMAAVLWLEGVETDPLMSEIYWQGHRRHSTRHWHFLLTYLTLRFITAFTNARQLSLSWASSIQSTPPHPTSWRSILILSSHLRLGLTSGFFPSGFPTRTLYTLLLSPTSSTCLAHIILLDFITRTILGEEYRSLSSSLCNFKNAIYN